MTKAPRSEESTGTTRRRRTAGGVGVAERGRPSVGAAPRVRDIASTGPELDDELNQIAKDLQQISAGARASGVMQRQRKSDLMEHLTRAQVHIWRATRAARAEATGEMRSSASGEPGSASGPSGGGQMSAARADQLRELQGELRRLRQELNARAPAQATINGEQTAPDRPTTATNAGAANHQPHGPEPTGDAEAAVPAIVFEAEPASVAATGASRRPLARFAGAAALVVVAAVAGLLLGRSTGDDATSSSQPAIAPASSQPVDYERAVGGQLEELAGARSSALERLRQAQSPAAQAAAGRDLAAAHRLAAGAIAATAIPASLKAVKRQLVDGLTRLAHGYRQLARAAADQNAAGTRTDGVRSDRRRAISGATSTGSRRCRGDRPSTPRDGLRARTGRRRDRGHARRGTRPGIAGYTAQRLDHGVAEPGFGQRERHFRRIGIDWGRTRSRSRRTSGISTATTHSRRTPATTRPRLGLTRPRARSRSACASPTTTATRTRNRSASSSTVHRRRGSSTSRPPPRSGNRSRSRRPRRTSRARSPTPRSGGTSTTMASSTTRRDRRSPAPSRLPEPNLWGCG